MVKIFINILLIYIFLKYIINIYMLIVLFNEEFNEFKNFIVF